MKTYRIATIPGDGIGKEVVPAEGDVLADGRASSGSFTWSSRISTGAATITADTAP